MKNLLSFFLCFAVLISLFTVPVFATQTEDTTEYTCGDYTYKILTDGTAEITRYKGEETEVLIPSTLDGYNVTSIGYIAFVSNSALTSVTIPEGVTNIGERAFDFCSGLTLVNLPDGLTTIGNMAFGRCGKLTSISFPDSLSSIDEWAFYASGFTTLTIPGTIKSIGDYAFSNCYNLTSLTICDGVESIGESAFGESESLNAITIPASVTSIEKYAFLDCDVIAEINVDIDNKVYDSRENCNAIIETKTNTLVYGCKNTVIPDSIKAIGDYAFKYCDSITSINIPNSVESIGDMAFMWCTELVSVNLPDSIVSIGSHAFASCGKLESLTIPRNVVSIGDKAFWSYSAFFGFEQVPLYLYENSYAHEFAIENELDFEFVDPNPLLGDVDGDKDISVMDATSIQMYVAKIKILPQHKNITADTDKDGEVSVMDATRIQMLVAKKIPEL